MSPKRTPACRADMLIRSILGQRRSKSAVSKRERNVEAYPKLMYRIVTFLQIPRISTSLPSTSVNRRAIQWCTQSSEFCDRESKKHSLTGDMWVHPARIKGFCYKGPLRRNPPKLSARVPQGLKRLLEKFSQIGSRLPLNDRGRKCPMQICCLTLYFLDGAAKMKGCQLLHF